LIVSLQYLLRFGFLCLESLFVLDSFETGKEQLVVESLQFNKVKLLLCPVREEQSAHHVTPDVGHVQVELQTALFGTLSLESFLKPDFLSEWHKMVFKREIEHSVEVGLDVHEVIDASNQIVHALLSVDFVLQHILDAAQLVLVTQSVCILTQIDLVESNELVVFVSLEDQGV